MTDTEKLIDKLGKLKRHAESAKEMGNEAEAQAFAEMFQKLVLANKIDVSELDFSQQEKDEPVDKHYIDYKKYDIRLKRRRMDWIESLAAVVAEAHFCRILVHSGSSRITLVGRKSDCEVAEYVLVTLQRAAEKMAKKAYYKYWFELYDKYGSGGTSQAAGFKSSWLDAFISRLNQRYRELRNAATSSSMALVRVNKAEKAILDWIDENCKGKAQALSPSRRWNEVGRRQGREAADAIDLGSPKAVKSGNTRKLVG